MTNRDRVRKIMLDVAGNSDDFPTVLDMINESCDRLAAEGLVTPDPEAIRTKIMTANKRLQDYEIDALVKALT